MHSQVDEQVRATQIPKPPATLVMPQPRDIDAAGAHVHCVHPAATPLMGVLLPSSAMLLPHQSRPGMQASIVAALSSDLGKVQQLVEQTSEQLAADPVASVQVRGGEWA